MAKDYDILIIGGGTAGLMTAAQLRRKDGTMLLVEFKYDNVRDSDPLLRRLFDTTKPLWSMWILKKYMLPWMYWNKMLRGTM